MPSLPPLSQPAKGKSNVRLAVITIVALHAVFFGGLLFQGCKPKTPDSGLGSDFASGTNAMDYGALTNQPYTDSGVASTSASNLSSAPLGGAAFGQPDASTQQPYVVAPPPSLGQAQTTQPLGQLPQQPVMQPATSAAVGGEYSIARGDTLAKIAKDHGVSVASLTKANPGVDPRKLKVGQKLTIPSASTPSAPQHGASSEAATVAAGGNQHYTVKSGDTLTKIAKECGVPVKELRSANALRTDRLQVGQKLKIPAVKAAAGSVPTQPTSVPSRAGTLQ
jgi:LysM repeat protein